MGMNFTANIFSLLFIIFVNSCTATKNPKSISNPLAPEITPNPAITTTVDFAKLTPTCFQAAGTNPLFTKGTFIGSFAKWNDPSILNASFSVRQSKVFKNSSG